MSSQLHQFVGRGSNLVAPNRCEACEGGRLEQLAADDELLTDERRVPTSFCPIMRPRISENDSPDIPAATASLHIAEVRAWLRLLQAPTTTNESWAERGDPNLRQSAVKASTRCAGGGFSARKLNIRVQCEPIMIRG